MRWSDTLMSARRRPFPGLLLAALLLALPSLAAAQIGRPQPLSLADQTATMQSAINDLGGGSGGAPGDKDGPLAKVGLELALLYEQYQVANASGASIADVQTNPLLHVGGGNVVVDVTADASTDALVPQLQAIGMQVSATAGQLVSGELPISAIPQLAALSSVRAARPAEWTTSIGKVTSQGDKAMRSDFARTTYSVDGTGVTVGVLSDSYNFIGGAPTDISTGDLPGVGNPDGHTTPINVIQDSGKTDEGRAMLQIVHDVAPGAALAFATANGGEANFASNITKLRTSAGAKIVVDDVIYYAEPMFQDGVIAQAADACFAAGVPYFSSAGNQARNAYESAFVSGAHYNSGDIPSAGGAPSFLGGTAHDFGGGDYFQSITIGAGGSMIVALEWQQPFASVSGGAGCQSDLDLYLLNGAANQVVGGSVNNNIGNDAVEVLGFQNTGATAVNYNLMIVLHSGSAPGKLKYVMYGAQQNEHQTNSGTIYGHANASGAAAVGAADYRNTPAYGVSPPQLEGFSSSGTTPILYTTGGAATNDPRSHKPNFTAPDGVDNTFFGGDSDGSGFPNFFGTSAAAPHAAAVAALMIQARSSATPTEIYNALESTAIDMDVAGFDNNTGAGLIQASGSVEAMDPCHITCAGDITTSNTPGQCGADVTFSAPTTSGLCGPVTLSQASGTFFPVGTTTVTATTASGNSCSFKVTVNDTEKPKITCPTDITVECDAPTGTSATDPAIVAFLAAATATDNCPGPIPITNNAPGFFLLGTTPVTFTATDQHGNQSSCTANVKVVDTHPPTIAATVAPSVLWPPNKKLVDVHATVTVTDVCDPSPTFTLSSITLLCDNQPDESTDLTKPDVVGADFGTPDVDFQLRAEKDPSRACTLTYQVTYTGADHSGNTANTTATVIVPHDQSGHASALATVPPTLHGVDAAGNLLIGIPSLVSDQTGVTDPSDGLVGRTPSSLTLTFDAAHLIGPTDMAIATSSGVVFPSMSGAVDMNGDGIPDMVAVFSATSLQALGGSATDPPIFYYRTHTGQSYEVASLVPLTMIGGTLSPLASTTGRSQQPAMATAHGTQAALAPPTVTEMASGVPNPTHGSMTFALDVSSERMVRIEVYDLLGARVRTLMSGVQGAGRYTLTWDGTGRDGSRAPNGVYLVRVDAGGYHASRKAVLLR